MTNPSNTIESSGISDIGPVREENQDTIYLSENIGKYGGSLYAVADGMGGYSNGKLASSMAIETLYSTFLEDVGSPEKRLIRSVESANFSIYQTTQKLGLGRMGTTLTALYLEGKCLTVAHVGDSRAYLVRGEAVQCLTRDHTVVGDLVRMKVLSPEKIRTHSQRSILTRGIGLSPFIHPDVTHHEVLEGDDLILCSDGLWSVIDDEELPDICRELSGVSLIIHHLHDLALKRGTDDNISAIGIHVHSINNIGQSLRSGGWQRLWSKIKSAS